MNASFLIVWFSYHVFPFDLNSLTFAACSSPVLLDRMQTLRKIVSLLGNGMCVLLSGCKCGSPSRLSPELS